MPIGGSERPTRRNAARTQLTQSSLFLLAKAFLGGPEGWAGSVLPLQGFAWVKKSGLCSGGTAAARAEHPGWLPPGQLRVAMSSLFLIHFIFGWSPFAWVQLRVMGWCALVEGGGQRTSGEEVAPGDLPLDGLPHAILPPSSLLMPSHPNPSHPTLFHPTLFHSILSLLPFSHLLFSHPTPSHPALTQFSHTRVKFPALADLIGQSCPWQLESNVPISQTQTGRFINSKNIQSPSPSKACNLFYSRQPNFI